MQGAGFRNTTSDAYSPLGGIDNSNHPSKNLYYRCCAQGESAKEAQTPYSQVAFA